jgi:hypothetical protein
VVASPVSVSSRRCSVRATAAVNLRSGFDFPKIMP